MEGGNAFLSNPMDILRLQRYIHRRLTPLQSVALDLLRIPD
jgi:hypothetical protein